VINIYIYIAYTPDHTEHRRAVFRTRPQSAYGFRARPGLRLRSGCAGR